MRFLVPRVENPCGLDLDLLPMYVVLQTQMENSSAIYSIIQMLRYEHQGWLHITLVLHSVTSHLLGYVFVSLSIEPGPSHYHVLADDHCNRKSCVLTPRCTYVAFLNPSVEPGSLHPGVMLAMTESNSNRSCLFDRVSLMLLTEMEPEGRSSASRSKYTSLACAYPRTEKQGHGRG